ncbi:MAG: hypothetical protein WBH97_01055 [Rectinemataceae bacterium]
MKRSFAIFAAIALAASMLLGSCDAFFTSNLFGTLDKPTAAEIAADKNSPDPEVNQPALALDVKLSLEESGAQPIVDNLVSSLLADGATFDPDADFSGFIDTLIPENIREDDEAFAAAIDALAASLTDLDLLAASVDSSGGEYAVEGMDVKGIAMTAVVATILNEIQPQAGQGTIGEALVAAYNNPGLEDTYIDIGSLDADTLDTLAADPTIATLVGLAGIDLANLPGSGS